MNNLSIKDSQGEFSVFYRILLWQVHYNIFQGRLCRIWDVVNRYSPRNIAYNWNRGLMPPRTCQLPILGCFFATRCRFHIQTPRICQLGGWIVPDACFWHWKPCEKDRSGTFRYSLLQGRPWDGSYLHLQVPSFNGLFSSCMTMSSSGIIAFALWRSMWVMET